MMDKSDKEFLLSLIPIWALETEPGLCATMYGTGSYEEDCAIVQRVKDIFSDTKD
jgi:hypothetical protein